MKSLRADAVRNRKHILVIAEKLFAKHGLGISVDDIARAAEIGIGTLYRHFPTKHALVAAVVQDQADQFAERVEELACAPRPAALRELLEYVLIQGASTRELLDVLGGIGLADSPEIAPIRLRIRRALTKVLAHAQELGEIRDDISLSDATTLLRGLFGTKLDDRARKRLLGVLFEGLLPRSATGDR